MNAERKTIVPAILWVDLETTGLSPTEDLPLEIALVVTDADLNEVAVYEQVVSAGRTRDGEAYIGLTGDEWSHHRELNPVVWKMHTENGLFEAGFKSERLLYEIEDDAVAFVKEYFGSSQPPLAGNSVHFDRAFLRRWLPYLHERLHYRQIDVSSIKVLAGLWGGPVPPEKNALAELRFYREQGFVGGDRPYAGERGGQ